MTAASGSRAPARAWWLPREVPEGHTLHCQVGPLALQLHHGRGEWLLGFAHVDEVDEASAVVLSLRAGGLEDEDDYERFMFARPDARVTLRPVLADRPVVIKPRHPVFLPSGEETTLYVSTPLVLRVDLGDPPTLLREVPTLRLSDTWFGPSTREGELCYSGKTNARLSLDEVPARAHRVITAVRIRNEGSTPLPLDRLSLPVPLLSVYGAVDGALWTQAVSLVRAADSDMAAIRVRSKPPEYAGTVEQLSEPRDHHARGGLVRAFSLLFGNGVR